MSILADRSVAGKHTNCFQAEQRRRVGAEGGHHGQHAFDIGRSEDRAQRLMSFTASQRAECFRHRGDALGHGQKLFDLGVVENEHFHLVNHFPFVI